MCPRVGPRSEDHGDDGQDHADSAQTHYNSSQDRGNGLGHCSSAQEHGNDSPEPGDSAHGERVPGEGHDGETGAGHRLGSTCAAVSREGNGWY